jgi:hypothetical protein
LQKSKKIIQTFGVDYSEEAVEGFIDKGWLEIVAYDNEKLGIELSTAGRKEIARLNKKYSGNNE